MNNSLFLKTNVIIWDIIFNKIFNIRIIKILELKLLSKLFNKLIINNRKYFLCSPYSKSNNIEINFFHTCVNGQLKDLKWMIKKFDLNSSNLNIIYILQKLCKNRGLLTSEHLLEKIKFLVETFHLTLENIKTDNYYILHMTCKRGYLEIVEYLITTFNLTAKDIKSSYNYALRYSCGNGHLELVKFLIGRFNLEYEDIKSLDHDALQWSCLSGHLEVARFLVQKFNLNSENVKLSINRILRISCREGNLEILEFLVKELGMKSENNSMIDNNYALQEACINGHFEVVKYLIEEFGLNSEHIRSDRNRALRLACKNLYSVEYSEINDTYLKIVKFLIFQLEKEKI